MTNADELKHIHGRLIGYADDLNLVAASLSHRDAFTDEVAETTADQLRRIAGDLKQIGDSLEA